MLPRSRYRAVLVLTAALLAGAGRVHGQRPTAPAWAPASEPQPVRALDENGSLLPAPSLDGRVVIASTRGQPPPRGPFPAAKLPDDALAPPPPPPFMGPVATSVPSVFTPTSGPVRAALFRPETDGAPGRPEDAAVVSAEPAGPAPHGTQVAVDVAGPASVAPGEAVHYEIVVRNTGPTPVALVHLEDPLPPGARMLLSDPPAVALVDMLTWDLGNLEPGAERRVKVDLQHDGMDELLRMPRIAYTTAVGLRTRVVKPTFSVVLAGPETAARGETVSFQVQLSNGGTAPARHVVVRDLLPPGFQHTQGERIEADFGDLLPGQTRSIHLDVTAVQSGSFINEVVATADGGLESRSRTGVLIRDAGLMVRLDAPRQTTSGRDVDCRLEAVNGTKIPARETRLMLTVPDGLDFASASTGGVFDSSSRRVVWGIGTLGGGQTQVVTVKLRGRAAGDWSCQATAEAEHLGAGRASRAVHVENGPSLHVELLAQEDPAPVGGETAYLLRVLNQGEAPATNVRLGVLLPDGLTPTHADGPTTFRIAQQQVTADPIATMAPRQIVEYHLRVRCRGAGTWRVEANLNADQLPQPLSEQVNVHVAEDHRPTETPFATGR